MNGQEIIEMAKEADVYGEEGSVFAEVMNKKIEAFAKLVAAKEREACAKWYEDKGWLLDESDIAEAIRARA